MPDTPALILASASPRRCQLLQQLGLRFTQRPSDINESQLPGEAVADYAQRMAAEKAQAAWQQAIPPEPSVLLSADTCGEIDGKLLAKPADAKDALHLLRQLSGRSHTIHSAFALYNGASLYVENVTSSVTFRDVSDDEIRRYWQTGEPHDKAGAYAIQGLGAQFVAHLDGSYSAVMGLPLFELCQAFKPFDIRTL